MQRNQHLRLGIASLNLHTSILADTFRCDETLRKISEFRLSPERSAAENAVDRRFQYIKGSVHQNTLDLPFIFQVSQPVTLFIHILLYCYSGAVPYPPCIPSPRVILFQFSLVKKFVGLLSETCPETVIDLNNKLMVQFLWKHLPQVSRSWVTIE